MIGQTYANLFPDRVRAMMLDGIVDRGRLHHQRRGEDRQPVSSADEVFEQFVALCQNAGPEQCALAGHGETVAQRVAELFARRAGRRSRRPTRIRPASSATGICWSRRSPRSGSRSPGPSSRKDLDAAADGDASALETAARAMQTPKGLADATKSSAISCVDGPARLPSAAWPG